MGREGPPGQTPAAGGGGGGGAKTAGAGTSGAGAAKGTYCLLFVPAFTGIRSGWTASNSDPAEESTSKEVTVTIFRWQTVTVIVVTDLFLVCSAFHRPNFEGQPLKKNFHRSKSSLKSN